MKIKVSSIQPGPQMNALVARARGITNIEIQDGSCWIVYGKNDTSTYQGEPIRTAAGGRITAEEYNPSGNGGQAMELVKEFNLWLFAPTPNNPLWQSRVNRDWRKGCGEDIRIEVAICRAVIAARFGDEVEV